MPWKIWDLTQRSLKLLEDADSQMKFYRLLIVIGKREYCVQLGVSVFYLINTDIYSAINYNGIHFSFHLYSGTTLYGHPLYTDSFVCPDKKLIYFL